MSKINSAVLFCGGKGSRLGAIGKRKNKSLLLVNNKPIIYYIITQLLKSRVTNIILPLGYKGDDVKKYIQKKFVRNISKFIFVKTGINTEISDRITKIKKYLPPKGLTFLLNGDTIFDFNLNDFIKSHFKSKKKISLATFTPKIDLGFIKMKNNKPVKFKKSIFISDFQTKGSKYLAYSGFIILDSQYLKKFKFNPKWDFEHEMYNKSIKSRDVNIFEIKKGTCFPIDNIKNLNYANILSILKN